MKPKTTLSSDKKNEKLNLVPDLRNKLLRLRIEMAEFYHRQLIAEEEALNYQVNVRGHSQEILKKYKIGYNSGKSVIEYALDKGYDLQDLVSVGCVKESNGGFIQAIPKKAFVYPCSCNGDVLHLTIKDADKKWRFQLRKKCSDPSWVGFGQDSLSNSEITVVEGEDDALSLVDKGKVNNVFATLGNFNIKNILEKFEQIAKGKIFNLAFDRDEAGKKYTEKFTNTIHKGGGIVRLVRIPQDFNDIDEFLQASLNPSTDLRNLLNEARIIENPPNSTVDSAAPKQVNHNIDSINVVGEEESGALVLEGRGIDKVYRITIKDLNYDQLLQVGGKEFKDRVNRNRRFPESNKIHFQTYKAHIILEARETQLGQLRWLGQGIHFCKNGRCLIVNGGKVYDWNGLEFLKYSQPIFDSFLIKKSPGRQWIDDFSDVTSLVSQLNSKRARRIREKFIDCFSQWGFQGGSSDILLLVGWVMAQVVQTIWDWRPHMWITGAQGSGKTLMLELINTLGGKLAKRREGNLSEAAMRQDIGDDACLYIIDEFERDSKDQKRRDILKLMRGAGRGGDTVKGTPGQKPLSFTIKHMIICASIEAATDRAAESYRFIRIETQKDSKRCPELPNNDEAILMTIELFALSLWAAPKAKELIDNSDNVKGYDTRLISSFKVPIAMLAACDEHPKAYFKLKLEDVLKSWKNRYEGDLLEDERRLYRDIMNSTIKILVELPDSQNSTKLALGERSVSQLLFPEDSELYIGLENDFVSDQYLPQNYIDTLIANGLRRYPDGILMIPGVIERKLLRDTQWAHMKVRDILKRIPGADPNAQRRIKGGNYRPRGILVPIEYDRM